MYQKYSDYSPKEVNGDGGWRRPEVRGGRGQRFEERKHEIKREGETTTGVGFGV